MSARTAQQRTAPKPSAAAGAYHVLQRKCACGSSAGLTGPCPDCQKKKLLGLQHKLALGTPGDAHEQEADRVADQVLRMGEPSVRGRVGRPSIQRQSPGDPIKQAPAKAPTEDAPQAQTATVATTPAVCSPTAMTRANFLKEPGTSTKDFGLTTLDLSAVTYPELLTEKVKGGVRVKPTSAALPTIPSVYTGSDTFTEGEAHFIGQNNGDCASKKYPIRWTITPQGASKIGEGEQEHCSDFHHAFDISLKRYADTVNGLAGKHFSSEKKAVNAVIKLTGAAPGEWQSVFSCLARKTLMRDTLSHTPKPVTREPRLATNCAFVSSFITGSSLSHIGQTSSADMIKGCGESGTANNAKSPTTQKTGGKLGMPDMTGGTWETWAPDANSEEAELLQRKTPSDGDSETAPPLSVHQTLAASGQPLDETTRSFMESRFGHDFGQVRLHTDSLADQSAREVNALAYTVGSHVAFRAGSFSPHTNEGRRLLAHELTHVVQQGAGKPIGTVAQQLRLGASHISISQPDQPERSTEHPPVDTAQIHVKGTNSSVLARTPKPSGGTAPVRVDGLIASEINMLNEVRGRLVPVAERSTAIVGILIAEDGRKFELKSGGGQGFSSHIEGKATAKMEELGITKATLLVEKEPCQICDRSVYPQETGPETPLKSSRTGADLSRQTPKINTAMKIGTELTVVDPHSASLYRGVKSVSVPALPSVSGSGTTPGTDTKGGGTAAPKPKSGTAQPAQTAPGTGHASAKPAKAAASGGAGTVASAEARLAAKAAAKDLSSNAKILKVARGLNGALHLVGFIGALLTLDTFTKMTINSLAGRGFILTKEIVESETLAKTASATHRDYLAFSERLSEMQPNLWRATQDSLAAGQAASSISDLDTSLDSLRGDLAEQIARVKSAGTEARAKQKAAENILSDSTASAAIAVATMGTAELAMLFAASQDMSRIAGQLSGAAADLTTLKAQIDEDFEFIHGWFEILFDICRKGGHCSLTVIDIPLVGTSRIHGLPGEASP